MDGSEKKKKKLCSIISLMEENRKKISNKFCGLVRIYLKIDIVWDKEFSFRKLQH